jgi:hypothetical protein
MTLVISLETRQCFSGLMMGMPPPTLASKAMSTPLDGRGVHDLLTVGCDERLVGGHHALAGVESREDDIAGDTGAPDELDDDIEFRIGDELECICGERSLGQPEGLRATGIAISETHEPDVDTGAPPEVLGMASEDLRDSRAHGSKTDQADIDGTHGILRCGVRGRPAVFRSERIVPESRTHTRQTRRSDAGQTWFRMLWLPHVEHTFE